MRRADRNHSCVGGEPIVCGACAEENPARARFCWSCGSRLQVDAATLAQGERRLVSVIFADLSGFTSYSERADMEEVRALADEAAASLGQIVERHGGIVDKIIGDCVMAVFGAPVSHEDDPERAVRAALEMQEHVTRNSDRFAGLPLRIGVNTGEVMFAPVGAEGRYTVLGDTVNTSARLQSAAPRGGILVGEGTYRATADAIDYESVEPIAAKGKDKPVPAWRAIGAHGAATQPVRTTPLVGRDRELSRLWEMWQRARTARTRSLALLLGDPGIGKSRLIEELVQQIGPTARVLRGRCLSYGDGITYWPVVEIIKQAAGILRDDEPAVVNDKLGTFLESFGSDDADTMRTIAVAVANLFGLETTPRGTYSATRITRAELHWGVARLVDLLAEQQPLVLVLEDLHWAESTLLELIGSIVSSDDAASLFVLGAARPEVAESLPATVRGRNARTIKVDALPEEAVRALLGALTGVSDDAASLFEELLARSAGNPLYLEELVRALRDAGAIAEDGTIVPERAAKAEIGASLRTLIEARLDRIPAIPRLTAQHAAVIGSVFWHGAVASLDPEAGARDGDLTLLEEREVLRARPFSTIAGEREFSFLHALMRDVAYERLPKSARAELHARAGAWFKTLPGEDFVEIIAYHLDHACRLAQQVARTGAEPPVLEAVEALTAAARRAEAREGLREAARFYARANRIAAARFPETSLEMGLREAQMCAALGEAARALEAFKGSAGEAAELGRDDLRCDALLSLGNLEQALAQVADAKTHLSEALELAEKLGDVRMRARASLELGSLRVHFEGSREAIADLEAALVLAETADLPLTLIEGHMRLGTHLMNLGELAEAQRHLERCVALAAQSSLRAQAAATSFLASIAFYRGALDDARRLATQAQTWLERTADQYPLIQNMRTLGKIALAAGNAEHAVLWLERSLPSAMRLGGWLPSDLNRFLAEGLVAANRVPEAREAANRAAEHAPAEDPYSRAAAAIADGLVSLAEQDPRRARGSFDEAIPLLEQQGLALDLAEACHSIARAWSTAGHPEDAEPMFARARDLFTSAGAHGMVASIGGPVSGAVDRAG